MKNSASVLTNFILIVLGVIMCLINNHPNIDHTIVRIIGSAFLIAGVINIFIMINHSSKHKGNAFSRISGWVSGIGGGLIGLAMIFKSAILCYCSCLSFCPDTYFRWYIPDLRDDLGL